MFFKSTVQNNKNLKIHFYVKLCMLCYKKKLDFLIVFYLLSLKNCHVYQMHSKSIKTKVYKLVMFCMQFLLYIFVPAFHWLPCLLDGLHSQPGQLLKTRSLRLPNTQDVQIWSTKRLQRSQAGRCDMLVVLYLVY